MEHSHQFPRRLTPGCPACAPRIEARNQAIAHLAEALHLLTGSGSSDEQATLRLNIGPINLTGADVTNCHSIDITPKQAEGLADAVDSMNSHLASESVIDQSLRDLAAGIEAAIPIDEDSLSRRKAGFQAWMEGQAGEAIESGEWSAAAVAQNDPDLYADVTDLFAELDPIEITDKVIRDRQADLPDVAHLLDDLFGDIPYPYADEDVPLPHDQAQMDALTSEVESHLKDGEL